MFVQHGKLLIAGFPAGEAPHLIFANREDIRDIELMTSKYRPVIEDTRSAIALDFDFVDKMVYWSDVAEEAIYRYVSSGNSLRRVSKQH